MTIRQFLPSKYLTLRYRYVNIMTVENTKTWEAQMTTKIKTQKQVQIIARITIKKNGIVVYKVRSSNGKDIYQTTFLNGKATGCTCPATKPCYHMTQLQAREDGRIASQQLLNSILNEDLVPHAEDDLASCDTCGRHVKPGFVTCAVCLPY